ncbi:helix-turn-helix transcriptional regulator [Myceligenerans halotolerans]
MNDDSIGQRIARQRKARGHTQTALAQRANISYSLLRKIESGEREVSQPVAAGLARALHVDVGALTGQPYHREGPRPDEIHDLIPNLRRALAYWDLDTELETTPRGPAVLAQDAGKIAQLYQLDQSIQVTRELPAVLMEAFATLRTTSDERHREVVFDALLNMFYIAHAVAYRTGYEDLSIIAEDRIQWISGQTKAPTAKAFADWNRCTSLMRMGEYGAGLALLDQAMTAIDPGSQEDESRLRMLGSLHLRSSILAARAGKGADATGHVAEARRISDRLDRDTDNDWRNLCFGPSNVAIHAVAASVEAENASTALAHADETHLPDDLRNRLPIRLGQYHMDLAKAYFWQGSHGQSLASLERARAVAPQQTRHHPTTRQVTGLLVRAHRRANEPLARFAAWLGPGEEW